VDCRSCPVTYCASPTLRSVATQILASVAEHLAGLCKVRGRVSESITIYSFSKTDIVSVKALDEYYRFHGNAKVNFSEQKHQS